MLTWEEFARLPEDELARQDLAEVNLACAVGLPDADRIDRQLCLRQLDYGARVIGEATERAMPRFRRKRYDYHNSEPYFRMLVMVTVLQRNLGVRYNPAKIDLSVPLDTGDIFIHGAILGQGGTCASLPVVYAAVGRRLGYPLKLVTARTIRQAGHVFVRWDDPNGERFNIDATSTGLVTSDDDYYRTGLYAISPETEQGAGYLKSLSPREELGGFLMERAHRWLDFRRFRRAVEAFAWASALAPHNTFLLNTLKMTLNDWRRELQALTPARFPEIYIGSPQRRFPAALPVEVEIDILGLEATENLLKDPQHDHNLWQPLRAGALLAEIPVRADADFTSTGCRIAMRFAATRQAKEPVSCTTPE